jgi:H+-translocating NAD(P) transhydrogenase subunit alpha
MWRRELFGFFLFLSFAMVMPAIAAEEKSEKSTNLAVPHETMTSASDASIPTAQAVPPSTDVSHKSATEHAPTGDYSSLLFVFMLATFIGLGVILRVSRLLHTPLMSLTNAISAIAVVGSIIVTGSAENPPLIRFIGAVALFCSMTNIVSGFLITDRMLKMFKSPGAGGKR